jgi:hypothetical protein
MDLVALGLNNLIFVDQTDTTYGGNPATPSHVGGKEQTNPR